MENFDRHFSKKTGSIIATFFFNKQQHTPAFSPLLSSSSSSSLASSRLVVVVFLFKTRQIERESVQQPARAFSFVKKRKMKELRLFVTADDF